MVTAVDTSNEVEEGRRRVGPPFRGGQFIFELLSGVTSGDYCMDGNTWRAPRIGERRTVTTVNGEFE